MNEPLPELPESALDGHLEAFSFPNFSFFWCGLQTLALGAQRGLGKAQPHAPSMVANHVIAAIAENRHVDHACDSDQHKDGRAKEH